MGRKLSDQKYTLAWERHWKYQVAIATKRFQPHHAYELSKGRADPCKSGHTDIACTSRVTIDEIESLVCDRWKSSWKPPLDRKALGALMGQKNRRLKMMRRKNKLRAIHHSFLITKAIAAQVLVEDAAKWLAGEKATF